MFRKLFSIIYKLFLIIPSFRLGIISAMGIGLGLGMSLVVFQNPDTGFASPAVYEIEKQLPAVPVSELKVPDLQILQTVADNELSESEKSEGLGSEKLAVVEVKDREIVTKLSQALLGQKILMLGNNNGIYSFTAIETRAISKSELNRSLSFYDEGLVIYGQKSRFSDELVLVVAR